MLFMRRGCGIHVVLRTVGPGTGGARVAGAFEVCIRTRKAGDAALSCRVYASTDLASVFPAGQ